MRRIFFDSTWDEELSRNGFVKLPLFRGHEAEELRTAALALDAECKRSRFTHAMAFRMSSFSENRSLRKRIFDELTPLLMPAVDRIIDDFVPLTANILCKEPGTGEIEMHQHTSCVDEKRFESITVHVPLVDTTRQNGTLEVVPGSHRIFGKYRGVGMPRPPRLFADFIPALKEKYCVPVDLKFGEVAILSDSLVHYSGVNRSEADRTVCLFSLHPREAKPIIYYWSPASPKRLEVYAVDADFMQRHVMPERPEGVPSLGVIPYREECLDEAEFAARLAASQISGAVPARGPERARSVRNLTEPSLANGLGCSDDRGRCASNAPRRSLEAVPGSGTVT